MPLAILKTYSNIFSYKSVGIFNRMPLWEPYSPLSAPPSLTRWGSSTSCGCKSLVLAMTFSVRWPLMNSRNFRSKFSKCLVTSVNLFIDIIYQAEESLQTYFKLLCCVLLYITIFKFYTVYSFDIQCLRGFLSNETIVNNVHYHVEFTLYSDWIKLVLCIQTQFILWTS